MKYYGDNIIFATGNTNKVNSAKIGLENLGLDIPLIQFPIDFEENQDTVEEIATEKVRYALTKTLRPVICDDSGFCIHSLDNWPGPHIKREHEGDLGVFLLKVEERLRQKGLDFLELGLEAHWIQALSYMDPFISEPELFINKVYGRIISEGRGDPELPHLKSVVGPAFIIEGQTKTLAELTKEEYKQTASSDRWERFVTFIKGRDWYRVV